MKLNIKALSLASGICFSLLYIVCAFFVWVAPQATVKFFNAWFHGLDLTKIAKPEFTFGQFLLGLILVFVVAAICAAVLAWLYNKLMKEAK